MKQSPIHRKLSSGMPDISAARHESAVINVEGASVKVM
jgi:hypothetical protein